MRRPLLPLLCAALIAAAGLSAIGCDAYFLYPRKEHVANPNLAGFRLEDIAFASRDGVRLHAWLLRPEGPPRGTILFLHGNAENVSTHIDSVLWLVRAGYAVFAPDYRGYGLSEGTADLAGTQIDGMAALDRVFASEGIDGDRVVLFGQSLGGAVGVYAAARSPSGRRLRAVILDGAFSGYRAIAREKIAGTGLLWPLQHPLSLLVTDAYSPVRWIRTVSPVPVLILHGDADRVVPFHHAEILFRAAGEPKTLWTVKGAGHVRTLADPDARRRLLEFLEASLGNMRRTP